MMPTVSGAQTVTSMLSHWSTVTPEAPFLVFDDDADQVTLTYRDGWELAARGTAVLAGLGVGRGDRFAVVLGNCVEFFACWFGAAQLGAVMVPVNPNSTANELVHFFEHASARAVICSSEQQDAVRSAWRSDPASIVLCGRDFEDRSSAPPPAPEVTISPLDPLAVLYTSGTTSRPKGVVVTHANYLAAGHTIAGQLRIRPDDRWLIVLPLFHANAQYYCVMSALVSGASAAVAVRFSASRWIRQARRCHATLASLFAAPARMILAQPESATDRENALRVTLFGQNLTPDQLRRFEDRFGCPLLQLYGMTETIAPPLMNPLYGPRDNMTVGLPTESGRVRIVADPLDRTAGDLAPGQTGELLIGGEPGITLMAGYLDDPDATAAAYVDGWLRTGDVVTRRHDELIAFHDRAKDMIKRSGENVAAAEVEWVVNQHPGVFESAVIGIPDPVRDEAIKAVVVRTEDGTGLTEFELIAFCADRLARGKVPDHVEFTDSLPRTSVGKIRKNLLRQTNSKGRA